MKTAQIEQKKNHAEQNAEGHAESILALYKAYVALQDGAETAEADGDTFTDADQVTDRVMESALSVGVRSDWHTPGDEDAKDEEFNILLTTGGPALRIVGDIGESGELEHQDWGTPWTVYRPDCSSDDDWEAALEWFVGCFCLEC